MGIRRECVRFDRRRRGRRSGWFLEGKKAGGKFSRKGMRLGCGRDGFEMGELTGNMSPIKLSSSSLVIDMVR